MLYLFIGAILAIGVKSQTLTPACSVDGDCDASLGTGVCGTITVAGFSQKTCIPCATTADCTSSSYYTTLYNGADNLECSDPLSIGVNACYPPYCGDGSSCASGYDCISDWCVSLGDFGGCSSDADCSGDETCFTISSVGVCVTGITSCSSDSDCSDPTPTCETTTYNICYKSCSTDSDCSSGTCDADTATGIKACSFDTDTTATGCTGDSDCTGTLVCNTDDGSCVICNDADDCSTGEACTNNVCLATSCSDDADCLFGYCRSDTCVICETDADCTGDVLYGTGYTCQTVAGVNVCSNVDLDDGINQITTYIAMIIMAFVAVNM